MQRVFSHTIFSSMNLVTSFYLTLCAEGRTSIPAEARGRPRSRTDARSRPTTAHYSPGHRAFPCSAPHSPLEWKRAIPIRSPNARGLAVGVKALTVSTPPRPRARPSRLTSSTLRLSYRSGSPPSPPSGAQSCPALHAAADGGRGSHSYWRPRPELPVSCINGPMRWAAGANSSGSASSLRDSGASRSTGRSPSPASPSPSGSRSVGRASSTSAASPTSPGGARSAPRCVNSLSSYNANYTRSF